MSGTAKRGWVWAGAGLTVVAVAGLGVYFAVVGLDKADKLASVIGGLTALVGLAVALYGLVGVPGKVRRVSQQAKASGRGQVFQVGGNQTAAQGPGGNSGGSDVPGSVAQVAEATDEGTISQVGGDQNPPSRP